MILALLIALSPIASAQPAVPQSPDLQLKEARRAAASGRLDQARLMIANAIAAGASPADADRAVADLAFDSGNYPEALGVYQKLLTLAPDDTAVLERAGIAALHIGNIVVAATLIDRATARPSASWRAWNARGAIADMKADWPAADTAYGQAERLAPGHFEVVNNRGWSRLLRGDWQGAVDFLQKAAALAPKSVRAANNLELARAALSADLPVRNPGEADHEWAARLNDAGMAAQLLGDRKRAIAAFTQALEASGSWYERAANNLQAASGQ
jgi:Flp pilus assembly protein TadD